MTPSLLQLLGDKRPYYAALRNPRNKKSGKRIYVNQIMRAIAKDTRKAKKVISVGN
jgi:hypothetical protein